MACCHGSLLGHLLRVFEAFVWRWKSLNLATPCDRLRCVKPLTSGTNFGTTATQTRQPRNWTLRSGMFARFDVTVWDKNSRIQLTRGASDVWVLKRANQQMEKGHAKATQRKTRNSRLCRGVFLRPPEGSAVVCSLWIELQHVTWVSWTCCANHFRRSTHWNPIDQMPLVSR